MSDTCKKVYISCMSTVNITPMNENIYTLARISEALECSSIPGVMILRLNSAIREYLCHCSETYEYKAEIQVVQKRTKKNKCSALLYIRRFFKSPEWYEITLTKDHTNHTPGDIHENIHTLPLAKKYLHELSQQLEQSSKSASQICIDMLRAIDRYRRSSDRKFNYYNIWNLMNKGNMSYSPNTNAFAYSFMSPTQQIKMRNAVSFCLDATHAISGKIDEILYTLLVCDKEIGRGWPVAFMVTNDRGVGPIVQWLQFLKSSLLLINPQQITIDCCSAEVHAIQTTFPSTQIQFCILHVTQAWNRKLSDFVKIPGALPSEAHLLCSEMMRYLQDIVYEDDLDQFRQKLVEFKSEFSDQELFLDYFEKNWCTEKKFKIWSHAYHECQFSHMLTNNYIELWHNQLKTVFMKRSRNKRLDKLVFILVHDVEYYLTQEYERVMSNNRTMSSFTRQQRIREIEAEEVDDDARETMIVASVSAEDSSWQVQSFVDENTAYVVEKAKTMRAYVFVKNAHCLFFALLNHSFKPYL
ncbi:hypothetical protein PHYBLDRAFT_73743 [Phycomyces blakesleeanus NRRL 1555(-)]|uniref:Uncharacterized protein n=1 Tax=Phycomyces blakesleeanus (strain ATCC 8743b / DSM 1359 / FGSC 10004 / NBRC 33097 / NRRL 1555) TaxID=763407 RepID=A0A167KPK1_PHYB8|nr:hypothetical protein PHYBLDRAFT_73743 [Phycomyces blakesleeanus NRRL 1555(-)]OAD68579.1 hypothetical protein PHYBLDRAFT_73743 [Phycomyces blakesleeanus NRRL 1555(-)]|eukprot:XP_018286619.1 hypothetical protein PHYBLDRAFT_73743 [Phycomyces blakesleeanus NRRL 1555(-)]